MILAVFSDSHNNAGPMEAALRQYRPDRVLFLGDGVRDAAQLQAKYPEINFTILRGNCDSDPAYDDVALLRLEGVRIFAAHGHNHGVNFGLDKFATSVLSSGSVIGFYGHTHRPLWQSVRGLQLVNPGSIGSAEKPTFALVTIKDGKADCRILDAPSGTEEAAP